MKYSHHQKLIFENNKYLYYASSLGYISRKTKANGKERIKLSFVKDGKLAVDIAGKTHFLGQIIAKAFMRDYHKNCCVGYRDGDRKNCNVENLYILTQQEEGKMVGKHNMRGKSVIVEENNTITKFKTIKEASKALYCSYRTLRCYLKGVYPTSVLDIPGRKIYYA